MIPSENESTQHRPTAQHDFESELLHKTQHTDFVLLSPNNSYPRQNITKKSCWVHQTGPGTPQSVESAVLLSNLRNVSQTRRRNVVLVPGATKQKRTVWTKAEPRGGGTAAASSSSFTIMKKEQGERGASRPLHDERDTADSNDGRTDGRRADPAKKRTNQVRGAGTSYPPSLFARKRRFGLDARTAMAALFFLSPSSPFFSSVVLFFLFLHQLFSFYLPTAPPIFFLSTGLN